MNLFSPRCLAGGLAALCALLPPALRGASKLTYADLFDNPVIAKGRGFEIRQQELDDNFRALKSTLATQGQTMPPAQEPAARKRLLDRLILAKVVEQRATDEDRKNARKRADEFIQQTKAKALNEASYARQLLAVGMTVEKFEQRAYEQALVEEVLNREIRAKLTVSDDEINAFYTRGEDVRTRALAAQLAKLEASGETNSAPYLQIQLQLKGIKRANLARLQRPERARANLILLYTIDRVSRDPLPRTVREQKKKLAEELVAKLRAGADFTELALKYSDDPDVQRTRGDYTAARDANMAPELKEALFTLPVGQISDPIPSRLGYYIVRVKERLPAQKVPLNEAEQEIRDFLLTQKVEQKLPEYFASLKKAYDVVITNSDAVK
jgi:parvulin-like peptidyl-prolyl isomerase